MTTVRNVSSKILFATVYKLSIYKTEFTVGWSLRMKETLWRRNAMGLGSWTITLMKVGEQDEYI